MKRSQYCAGINSQGEKYLLLKRILKARFFDDILKLQQVTWS